MKITTLIFCNSFIAATCESPEWFSTISTCCFTAIETTEMAAGGGAAPMEEMAEEVILQRLLRQMKSTVFVGIEPHWATADSLAALYGYMKLRRNKKYIKISVGKLLFVKHLTVLLKVHNNSFRYWCPKNTANKQGFAE